MDRARDLPPHLVEQAREYAAGRRTPAEPRNAATVVLGRSHPDPATGSGSLELYFLRRHVGMAFAAGMAVFPGGGVDPRDFAGTHGTDGTPGQAIGWAGPSTQDWAIRLGTDASLARALVCAAVRETFEESGVLLAGPTPETVVADTTGADWEADRVALEARELSFSDFLRRRGLLLRSDLLTPWACWLTPVFEPRRYRTWFFLAGLPDGQHTRDVSTESDEVMWLDVRDALTSVHEERLLMMPPQYCTCVELYGVADPADAATIARTRELELVRPTAKFHGDGAHLEIPQRLVDLAADVRRRMGQ